MRFFRSAKPSRLFILGLDGSPLPLLQRLMTAGDLPNLARIFEGGSAVEMTSSLPDVSAVAWTSVNTGKNPAKHGIYGFVDRRPGTDQLEVMTAKHVRAKTIWELVSDAGRRAIAVNVPLSFPPQRINGVVISDFLAPKLDDRAVYPTTLLPQLEHIGYRIDTDPYVAQQSLDAFLDDFRATAQKRAETVLYLMENEAWDLFMVVFMETDRLHHFLWRYMEEGSSYGEKFVDAYRQIDAIAGRIVDRLRPDDALIVMSDHGFTTLKKEVYLNVWLEEEGYLRFVPGNEKSLASIDHGSRVYSLDPGRIYVNLNGREPDGAVSPNEASSLIDEVAHRLSELRDPDTGDNMVKHVYRADQIYVGPQRNRAPDLLAMPYDGYDIKGSFASQSLTGRGKLVGMHKYDNATFFVRGHRIATDRASVHDVLPTACKLMNLDCPPDVDGKMIIA